MAADGLIDFEGDYGADYDHLIRIVIAGYELMHELGVAAARAVCPQAGELLIVGPAWHERLRLRGIKEAVIDQFAAARGREVFAVDPQALAPRLLAAGCTEPWPLFQGAHVSLWCSRKLSNA